MVYKPGEELKIKRELDIRNRASLLNESALRAALLSIQNIDELERVVKIGEGYMEDVLNKREEWMRAGMRIALKQDLKDELQK